MRFLEPLETRLSPVGVPVTLTTAALVFIPVTDVSPSPQAPDYTPPNDWSPPIDIPPIPFGPAGPA